MPQSNNNITIITANHYLAHTLQQAFDCQRWPALLKDWQTPDIVSLEQWLLRTWQLVGDGRTVLTDLQELHIWQHVISQHPATTTLLWPQQLACLVQEAWALVQAWQLDLAEFQPFSYLEMQLFCEWAETFKQYCHQHNFLSAAQLLPELLPLLSQSLAIEKQRILLAGFYDKYIYINKLFDCLKVKSYVDFTPLSTKAPHICSLLLNDQEQEITAMARFAQQLLQDQPTATIGCAVPNLNAMRQTVERIFQQVFSSHIVNYHQNITFPFHIVGGTPLSSSCLISCLINILELIKQEKKQDEIGRAHV